MNISQKDAEPRVIKVLPERLYRQGWDDGAALHVLMMCSACGTVHCLEGKDMQ